MEFLLNKNQIEKKYIAIGNSGCLASNRITVDGLKVGYMYREESSENFPDSGWRFFAGDESQEYTDEFSNFNIFDLNTICNYDETIISYLNSPVGVAYIRQGDKFVLDLG